MSPTTTEWKNLLHFRDYLISHPEEAKQYKELKKTASEDNPANGTKYRELKDPLIRKILDSK